MYIAILFKTFSEKEKTIPEDLTSYDGPQTNTVTTASGKPADFTSCKSWKWALFTVEILGSFAEPSMISHFVVRAISLN